VLYKLKIIIDDTIYRQLNVSVSKHDIKTLKSGFYCILTHKNTQFRPLITNFDPKIMLNYEIKML